MKKYLAVISFLLVAVAVKAQTPDTTTNQHFISSEQPAEYPGDVVQFQLYIKRSVERMASLRTGKEKGDVKIGFTVDTNGRLTDVKVLSGLTEETNAQAITIIQKSVRWKPAMQNGKWVKQTFDVVVHF